MTRARKITAVIFAALGISLIAMVLYYWTVLGCDWTSLASSIVFYTLTVLGLWTVADDMVKDLFE